jgi:hypothetical protein
MGDQCRLWVNSGGRGQRELFPVSSKKLTLREAELFASGPSADTNKRAQFNKQPAPDLFKTEVAAFSRATFHPVVR